MRASGVRGAGDRVVFALVNALQPCGPRNGTRRSSRKMLTESAQARAVTGSARSPAERRSERAGRFRLTPSGETVECSFGASLALGVVRACTYRSGACRRPVAVVGG